MKITEPCWNWVILVWAQFWSRVLHGSVEAQQHTICSPRGCNFSLMTLTGAGQVFSSTPPYCTVAASTTQQICHCCFFSCWEGSSFTWTESRPELATKSLQWMQKEPYSTLCDVHDPWHCIQNGKTSATSNAIASKLTAGGSCFIRTWIIQIPGKTKSYANHSCLSMC